MGAPKEAGLPSVARPAGSWTEAIKKQNLKRRDNMELVKRLFVEEEGQDLTEYALIIALVSIALIVGLQALAGGIGNVFNSITNTLNSNS